jgi:hypothetical protein
MWRDRWEETEENRKRERKLGAGKETWSAKGKQERESTRAKKPGPKKSTKAPARRPQKSAFPALLMKDSAVI